MVAALDQTGLVMARAAAISAGPFVDLGIVTVEPPPTSAMIGVRAGLIQKTCWFSKVEDTPSVETWWAGRSCSWTATPRSVASRGFSPTEGSGPPAGGLCVAATGQGNKIFAVPCRGSTMQVWTRGSNRLRGSVELRAGA